MAKLIAYIVVVHHPQCVFMLHAAAIDALLSTLGSSLGGAPGKLPWPTPLS